jgi:hypothetical protein
MITNEREKRGKGRGKEKENIYGHPKYVKD